MRITTSKGYINDKGVSTSAVVRKLGTLNNLLKDHESTRDDVMVWAREETRLETVKYKKNTKSQMKTIQKKSKGRE